MLSTPHTVRLAASYFLAVLVLVALVAWPGYAGFIEERKAARAFSVQGHLALLHQHVDQQLFTAGAQVRMLSRLALARQAIRSGPGGQEARKELSTHFVRLATNFPIYSQLRVLDPDGQELVRVNRSGDEVVLVPTHELQYKGGTDYFRAAKELGIRELFLSRVGLNEENGRLQYPLVPTLRMASPVIDPGDGALLGVVVVNLNVDGIFQRADDLLHSERSTAQFSLLNQDGYWLFSKRPDQAWGWLLGRSDQNLERQNPQLWKVLSESDSVWLETTGGMYIADTIYPLRAFAGAQFEIVSYDPTPYEGNQLTTELRQLRWIAMVLVSDSDWLDGTLLHQRWVLGVIAFLVALLAVGSWFAARQQVMRQWVRDTEKAYAKELSELYEHAPCGYQSVDALGMYVRINDTALEWVGYTRDEVVGKLHYSHILLPDEPGSSLQHADTHLEVIKSRGELIDFPMLMRRKDGSTFPVSLSARAVYNSRGEFLMTRTTLADMTERRELEAQLREQAFTDPLTGAVNRRHFTLLAQQEIRQLSRGGQSSVLVALDIDHFKRINDTYGHALGDTALKIFVQSCQACVRSGDIVARMGGEEFAILLPKTTLAVGINLAERIRLAVQAIELPVGNGKTVSFSVSAGVVAIEAADASLEGALAHADKLLYRAKANGRNRVESDT